ncbi:hypothetical protein JZ751_024372 [Albula glossodonta]|uniref:Schwannomin interacting protein 1 C-terminal domain-containing protein n=1 Tax=Albula glossodonta TaxID=121402 RepID=A0A8T2NN32_9TELE|nr:hypothetical protein JZ751_024372 [Albula glossodonta]
MEEEKERESEREEEKENDETEDSTQTARGAALSCQEGTSMGDPDLPIMHWEALSLRIAELEKQEEERKERLKSAGGMERGSVTGCWMDERDGGSWWEDVEADRSRRITALTSRFTNQKNLQLCFINDSESDDDEEEEEEVSRQSSREGVACGRGQSKQVPPPAAADGGRRSRGLKMEVRAALSALRDKLWSEQREKEVRTMERLACSGAELKRKPLSLSELQALSLQQLDSLRASLTQAIHGWLLWRDSAVQSEMLGSMNIAEQLVHS